MRGTVAKRLRNFSIPLFMKASADENHKRYCEAQYMINPKTNQIMCAGYRGIYRAIKRMYLRNEEVIA